MVATDVRQAPISADSFPRQGCVSLPVPLDFSSGAKSGQGHYAERSEKLLNYFNSEPDKDTTRQNGGTDATAHNYRSGGAFCRNFPRMCRVRTHHDCSRDRLL
jgi:hypothetical protein